MRGIVLSIFRLFFGTVKVKILATIFGVNGIGELSLVLQFQLFAQTLLSMGLAVIIINIARPFVVNNNLTKVSHVLGTGVFITTLNFLFLFLIVGVLFYLNFINSFKSFNSIYIWLIIFAALFTALASVLWESICFLLNRYDLYVKVNSNLAFFDSALYIIGAWTMGFEGVFLACFLSGIFQFLIYAYFLFREKLVKILLNKISIKKIWIKPLYSQSFRLQSISLLVLFAPLLARAYIINVYGTDANGYLQVATALSSYLLPFIMNGVWGHLHPLVAANGDNEISRRALRTILLNTFPLIIVMCLLVGFFCPFLIKYLYTSEFTGARETLVCYFVSEPLYISLSIISAYLIAIQKYKLCFFIHSIYFVLLLITVYFFAKNLGSLSYALGHFISTSILFLLAFIFICKEKLLTATQIIKMFILLLIFYVCFYFDIFNIDLKLFNIKLVTFLYLVSILFILSNYLIETYSLSFKKTY